MKPSIPHDFGVLGRQVEQQPSYNPAILMPIARALSRASLDLGGDRPFVGSDRWTGYELSWLEPGGKPRVAILRCVVPADSPQLIESKSFKLYLNSYAREHIADLQRVQTQIAADLSACAGASVTVEVLPPAAWSALLPQSLAGECIDELPLPMAAAAAPKPELLQAGVDWVEEALVSHLLKSNCPVTGQPDWGSVQILYRGPRIERAGLLGYLVSFREVCEFHEHCVERIFVDLMRRCAPEYLSVQARYTRRGGLDINPYRASAGPAVVADCRQWRQ